MSRLVYDIETDGLLLEATRQWIMTATDITTEQSYEFLEGDLGWMKLFDDAEEIIGHHILGFDNAILEKLFGYKIPKHVRVKDTLIMSQVLDYKRFGNDGHSLDRWGEHFGIKKPEHTDWTQFSPEMRHRNQQDVRINVKVYQQLTAEYKRLYSMEPKIKYFMQAEHAATKWCTSAQLHGWPFDVKGAEELHRKLEVTKQLAYDALSARLGTKTIAVDKAKGVVESKTPKWTKQGFYDAHTANWFGVHPCSGFEGEERLIAGPYSRITFEPLSLNSVTDVKTFLYRHGWVPTEWNVKVCPVTRKKTKTSPKITEDSIEFLGGDAKLYTDFLTARSRYAVVKTWLENTDAKGNLHGDCMVIGTASMRARHSIIVNVPSTDSAWGPEMRSLFKSLPGWSLIGCDSSGNQARGLAHYLGDADFINTLLHGDVHQFNADLLTAIVHKLYKNEVKKCAKEFRVFKPFVEIDGFIVKRSQAKRILYAFLFGASGSKLWSYIFGNLDEERGKILKREFIKAVPGFATLLEKLENIYGSTSKTGDGYIPSLAGNRIYVDSFHKLLVYLLQATEKITCSSALMVAVAQFEKENIPYIPCIYYHDEIDFMVPDEFAVRAAEIGKNAFKEGPKLYGIEIMDGDAKIGKTWFDVH